MKARTKWVKEQLKRLPEIKTNPGFMDKLMRKIDKYLASKKK